MDWIDFIDWIDIYRRDRLYRRDRHLIDKINYYRQDGRNEQHEAGQAAEETRHMLVEMLKMQQNEDF